MGEVIQFPVKKSNGYYNFTALFEICDSIASCNAYFDIAETLFENGDITENELHALRRMGRSKRLELATPPQGEALKAEKPGVYVYAPEMGQQKPEGCQIEAHRAYYGGHVFIDTPLKLKGRGIRFLKTYKPGDLTSSGQYKSGWNTYEVTNRAYNLLKTRYAISWENCLD